MGFLIIIGPNAAVNKGEVDVAIDAKWRNTASLTYACADTFSKLSTAHGKLWAALRGGDTKSGDPVTVRLTDDLVGLIETLFGDTCGHAQALRAALRFAHGQWPRATKAGTLWVETR